ncbi:conserved hypothetical protein [Candidatus Desulfarcum epimagneticum]|uniref:Uncharacterized protein n=1 Tax=uncultured Desulfobacteraceae bacterium TaxID=218296 RepID=A0A484HBK2_9BACT|nr:conserved hypothetical protein [uncultured Desulfobacteraceae bacterium]
MDYSKIFQELNKATSFDLYRLKVLIDQQLENPHRLSEIKRRLKPGQKISYFDETENRLIDAIVIKLMRKKLLVENIHDQEKWQIPFYFVNLNHVNADIMVSSNEGIDRSRLKVGDTVGFQDKQNNDLTGKIIRLNQKTATILTTKNAEWRVAYEYLYFIYDVEPGSQPLIRGKEGETGQGNNVLIL